MSTNSKSPAAEGFKGDIFNFFYNMRTQLGKKQIFFQLLDGELFIMYIFFYSLLIYSELHIQSISLCVVWATASIIKGFYLDTHILFLFLLISLYG